MPKGSIRGAVEGEQGATIGADWLLEAVPKLCRGSAVGQSHSVGTGVIVTIVYSAKSLRDFDLPFYPPYSGVAGLSSK
jgi:hypothetical protein